MVVALLWSLFVAVASAVPWSAVVPVVWSEVVGLGAGSTAVPVFYDIIYVATDRLGRTDRLGGPVRSSACMSHPLLMSDGRSYW